jgi:hypothetical protein
MFGPNNPLAQIAQFPLPNISASVTNVANAMASAAAARERHEKEMKKMQQQQNGGSRGPRPPKQARPLQQEGIIGERDEHDERYVRVGARRLSVSHVCRREKKDQNHIKKPLNAFMIFMKENRQKLMEEKGYKERQSAELNKELGRLVGGRACACVHTM